MTDHIASKVGYLVIGLGIGSLIGILFAPKSGEETRALVNSKADEGREYVQKKAQELRSSAENLIKCSKEIISSQTDSISAAVDAGKVAYEREKSKAATTS
ncbi:MAG: YtxH domain-containing protein [Candidatus Acidiferrales bacterium]|jgi:gas vesicle protein